MSAILEAAATATTEATQKSMTFDEVFAADAEFRTNAAATANTFDPLTEVTALSTCFEKHRAGSTSNCELWKTINATYEEKIAAFADAESIGRAIQTVVIERDAEHLRPTSILQRLDDGVNAAVFGIKNLVEGMQNNN